MAQETAALLRSLPGNLCSALTPQFVSLNLSLTALAPQFAQLNTSLATLASTFSTEAKVERESNFEMFKLLLAKK